eukprot:CAMPEP_0206532402 /NCGR_PEP_ID=MMETSP0325_2-20121206/4357_1 /ASSEMBLY_ACC=CAM_ASM_000347 /TAXON_ID=2866 /ORGANISM="Crypthecodinium cohnii, Strain Seligo" /LENGTH=503 /DNA_ID=CAMNT_0054028865 /DNA_START=7 /DNA_END=1514 /DNA_ORIENTATION=+
MANFSIGLLKNVVEEIKSNVPAQDLDPAVLLAARPGLPDYALPIELPPPSHPLRERGMQLLWVRSVTVAAAIVGSANLKLFTKFDETFERLKADFASHPKVTEHLAQYGDFALVRATEGELPGEMRMMPFISTQAKGTEAKETIPETHSEAKRVFVGVDYGRSDVKCAVVDADGKEVSTYVTRWWDLPDGAQERQYLDPACLNSIDKPLRCLGEGALEVVKSAVDALKESDQSFIIAGLGLSAAGCVRDGKLCGLPPVFGGCDAVASAAVLDHLERCVLEYLVERLGDRFGSTVVCHPEACKTMLVNDGDASAMWGAQGLDKASSSVAGCSEDNAAPEASIGLFLSCGTGLAGGIVKEGGYVCGGGVLEAGKLIIGLPLEEGGVAPKHDTLLIPAAAQGVAGTQRSFFNLLAARGGERIEGKAEQRAAIVAMQKRPLDEEVRSIFECLGTWLAAFVEELSVYLPFQLTHVEAGGKLTDAASGEVMLTKAKEALKPLGINSVRR